MKSFGKELQIDMGIKILQRVVFHLLKAPNCCSWKEYYERLDKADLNAAMICHSLIYQLGTKFGTVK